MISKIINYMKEIRGGNRELLWASIWHDTIKGIEWINDDFSVSPGRMAVGYDYLYVATRILNELRPHKVLEFGLGVSTTLISEYFNYYKYSDFEHLVIEHDESWTAFYSENHKLPKFTEIVQKDLLEKVNGDNRFFAYANLDITLQNKKYEFISIDAPYGNASKYARRDILEFIPDILENSFVIIMDDLVRLGEQTTFADIKNILAKNNIEHCSKIYYGKKDCGVIVSKDNKFICSL